MAINSKYCHARESKISKACHFQDFAKFAAKRKDADFGALYSNPAFQHEIFCSLGVYSNIQTILFQKKCVLRGINCFNKDK